VRRITALSQAAELTPGEILVTHMTAPDWVPLMRRAAAIVTDSGGMTCHAAIVSRELGIPCVVGTRTATAQLRDGELVTVDATHGVVLEGSVAAAEPPSAPAAEGQSPRPSCSSTCPSRRRSSAPPRCRSTASACCAPS
jgi:pyruvate,water dikinase